MSETQTETPAEKAPEQVFSRADVIPHNKASDLWVIVDNVVYDLTKFQDDHPGGKKILMAVAGTDASKKYRKYHGDNVLRRYGTPLRIGTIKAGEQETKPESKSFFSRFRKK